MSAIAVIHLVRKSNGLDTFRGFVDSYRRHRAGEPHELIVAYKGFRRPAERRPYEALLADTAHRPWNVHDRQLDLPVYLAAARTFQHSYCLFLNSFSRLLDEDWLAKLASHALRPGVGAVGATGSSESLREEASSDTLLDCGRFKVLDVWRRHRRRRLARISALQFPPFPNPHLRTNAFLIARRRMLGLRVASLRDKRSCWRFESGVSGMTQQLVDAGLEVLVVGRNGRAYQPVAWATSRTFRSGRQQNLLVADNRTEQFRLANTELRGELAWQAWGHAGLALPAETSPGNQTRAA